MNENDGAIAPASGPDPSVMRRVQGMRGVEGSGDTSGPSRLAGTEVYARPTSRLYGGQSDFVVDVLAELLEVDGVDPDATVEEVVVENGQLVLFVVHEHLVHATRCLCDDRDLRSEMCFSAIGIYYPQGAGCELHGCFPLSSITHNRFLATKSTCPGPNPRLPLIVETYPGNDWPGYEAQGLTGIVFDEHPGFIRTAIPGDWTGHPQCKDYSLGGTSVEYKDVVASLPDVRRDYG